MEISRRVAVRYGLALVGGLPAATAFAGSVALCFGEKDLPGDDWIILASFAVGWAGVTVWAALAGDARQTFRRACLSFTASALLLPVAALVFAFTEPPLADPVFTGGIVFSICLAAGAALAAVGWLLARYVPRLEDTKFKVATGAMSALVAALVAWFLIGLLLRW